MAIQKGCHMRHLSIYIKCSQKGQSTIPTQATDAISLSRSTQNTKPLGHRRHQQYLQP
jgi:hypothetical protein